MFDNSVRDWRNQIVGFRCRHCDKVKSQMWGDICNECREVVGNAEALKRIEQHLAVIAKRNPDVK